MESGPRARDFAKEEIWSLNASPEAVLEARTGLQGRGNRHVYHETCDVSMLTWDAWCFDRNSPEPSGRARLGVARGRVPAGSEGWAGASVGAVPGEDATQGCLQ